MAFNQKHYISDYNKSNYKMYQFRVKKSEEQVIEYLDKLENRNQYILSLVNENINKDDYIFNML